MNKTLPSIKSLPIFSAVAKANSFIKAAETLHVTASAVSQQIKLLEQDLGVKLFKRGAGGVCLTESGARYAEQINIALGVLQEATRQIRQKATESNKLTVHVMNTFAAHWLIPRLTDFYLAKPHINLQLSTHWRTVDINMEAMEVLIGYGTPKQWPGLYTEKLMSDHLIAVVQPTLLQSLPTTLKDRLAQTTWIIIEDELRAQDWPLWLQAADQKLARPQKYLSAPSTLHGLQAARNGLGVFVTHQIFAQQDLSQGTLSMLAPIIPKTPSSYYWVSPKPHLYTPSVQAFKQWITHIIKEPK